MQKFRAIAILVLSPIPQHGKNSIADCKNIRIFPDIWHMSVGSHRGKKRHIKKNPNYLERILRNFDVNFELHIAQSCNKII